MGLDYDARLTLRRVAGVLGPVLLLPAAVWFYLATPPSALAEPPAPDRSVTAEPSTEPPAALSATAAVVRVTVRADGSYDVVESVRLAEPTAQLRLAPRDLGAAGASFADAAPVHSQVEVVVPGERPVPVPELGTGLTVPLPEASTAVEVRYRLDGASVRTVPGPPGRALGAVAPLVDGAGLLVGFELAGDPVLAVACPNLPADQLICGTEVDGTLVVDPQPVDTALVVAQLDLDA